MKKAIILVDELYEDLELWYPKIRLEEAGFHVQIAGPSAGHVYQGRHGYPCLADLAFKEVKSSDYCCVIIPGGYAPDKIRRCPDALKIVKEIHAAGKLVAMICHGGWVAISAHILKGKKLTGTSAIKDDLENAGGIWHDQPVVVDKNLISSRSPRDLAFFAKEIIQHCHSK